MRPVVTRFLVVNADGAGLSSERDAGILEAFDHGVVTSASVVVNGPTAASFMKEASTRPGLGLGLNLNLTQGPAVSGRAFTLTDMKGQFLGDKDTLWKRAVGAMVDPHEVSREVVAQWHKLQAWDVEPDHVDGHHHVHVLDGVADGMLDALAYLRASVYVRVPAEGDPPPDAPPVTAPAIPVGTLVLSSGRVRQVRAGHGGIAALGAHADALKRRLRPPLKFADGFTGLAFATEPSEAMVRLGVVRAPGNVVEWMVHPGRSAVDGTVFSGDPRRDAERRILCDPATRAAIDEQGLTLASFRELLAQRTTA